MLVIVCGARVLILVSLVLFVSEAPFQDRGLSRYVVRLVRLRPDSI